MSKKSGKKGAVDIISKFQGDGLSFKAKLYGTAAVKEARGDVMCQQAMQLMKSAAKNSNEHKQKIVIRINISGVTLIDASNNQVLHQHQVNRISFISKDSTDSRSFSYIVGGEGDGKHTLFGLKTDKPSEAVVLSLRDLFQAVYQLNQQKRSSRASSTLSVESGSRASVSSSAPSNKVVDNSTNSLPLNITEPASPLASSPITGKPFDDTTESGQTAIENPPDVIPTVALGAAEEDSSDTKVINVDPPHTEDSSTTSGKVSPSTADTPANNMSVKGEVEESKAEDSDTNEKVVMVECTEGVSLKPDQHLTMPNTGASEALVNAESVPKLKSSPSSSVRSSTSSSRPAMSDSLSMTSNDPSSIPLPNANDAAKPADTSSPFNPWEQDVNFGDDPFFNSSAANAAVDSNDPWGAPGGAEPAGSGDPWSAFGTDDGWAASDNVQDKPAGDDEDKGFNPFSVTSDQGRKSDPFGESGNFEVNFSTGFANLNPDDRVTTVDADPNEVTENLEAVSAGVVTASTNGQEDESLACSADIETEKTATVEIRSCERLGESDNISYADANANEPAPEAKNGSSDDNFYPSEAPEANGMNEASVVISEEKHVVVPQISDDPFGAVTPDPDNPFNREPDPFSVSTRLTAVKLDETEDTVDVSADYPSVLKMKIVQANDPETSIDEFTIQDNTIEKISGDSIVESIQSPIRPIKEDPSVTDSDSIEPLKAVVEDPFEASLKDPFQTSDDDPFNPQSEDPFQTHTDDAFLSVDEDPFKTSSKDPFAETDPFAGNDPFAIQDPFTTNPFLGNEDPFAANSDMFDKPDNLLKSTSEPAPEDPFAGIDPFASSGTSVTSLKVDSDPFSDLWSSFKTNGESEKSPVDKLQPSDELIQSDINSSNPPSLSIDILQPTVQPDTENRQSVEVIGATDEETVKMNSSAELIESDDDQLTSFAPPTLPPPTLPPEVLANINTQAVSPAEPIIRSPPPAIPARRPLSTPPTKLPPVPSRNKTSRASSLVESHDSSMDDSLPELPPPSLPPPKLNPPQLPNRNISVNPPKIPDRPQRSSTTDTAVIGTIIETSWGYLTKL